MWLVDLLELIKLDEFDFLASSGPMLNAIKYEPNLRSNAVCLASWLSHYAISLFSDSIKRHLFFASAARTSHHFFTNRQRTSERKNLAKLLRRNFYFIALSSCSTIFTLCNQRIPRRRHFKLSLNVRETTSCRF